MTQNVIIDHKGKFNCVDAENRFGEWRFCSDQEKKIKWLLVHK